MHDHPLQLGGVRTGSLDYPDAGGGQSCRVAWLDTGGEQGGLRVCVALDRGGDLVEASYRGVNLAYLTPNGYKPPSPAYHHGEEWLRGWPGGLLTTCGPETIGRTTDEDGRVVNLHGRFSNTPAAVVGIHQPSGEGSEFGIDLLVRDTRMFGPCYEVRRSLRGRIGGATLDLRDVVMNIGDRLQPHSWLYHINPGYPLLDTAARLVYRGKLDHHWLKPAPEASPTAADLDAWKTIPPPQPDHAGGGERGVVVIVPEARGGDPATVGLVNRHRSLGLAIRFRPDQLPRLANWQHLGPRGSYVTGIEPFAGTMIGSEDPFPGSQIVLEPGESRVYDLSLSVTTDLDPLLAHDGPILAS